MRIVLKFSNNIYNTINNPEINVIYFFNNKRFYFHEFKMGDSYEYRRYAMLNYNIFSKRLKMTSYQLQNQLNESDWGFSEFFQPLFKNEN